MRALSGAAARLWYQAGMPAAPFADAAISQPPFPSETQPRGVVRSRPLLRPVVVRSRRSKSKPGGFLAPLRSRLATKPFIPSRMRPLGCQAPRVPERASKVDMGGPRSLGVQVAGMRIAAYRYEPGSSRLRRASPSPPPTPGGGGGGGGPGGG